MDDQDGNRESVREGKRRAVVDPFRNAIMHRPGSPTGSTASHAITVASAASPALSTITLLSTATSAVPGAANKVVNNPANTNSSANTSPTNVSSTNHAAALGPEILYPSPSHPLANAAGIAAQYASAGKPTPDRTVPIIALTTTTNNGVDAMEDVDANDSDPFKGMNESSFSWVPTGGEDNINLDLDLGSSVDGN
jgi:hypothetical protein